jgi:hypothetical protein
MAGSLTVFDAWTPKSLSFHEMESEMSIDAVSSAAVGAFQLANPFVGVHQTRMLPETGYLISTMIPV